MSVVNIASRNLSEAGPDHLGELAVSLSSRLTRVPVDGMPAALAESLAEIAAAHGRAAPVLDRLVRLVHEIEDGRRPLDRANLDALAEAVP